MRAAPTFSRTSPTHTPIPPSPTPTPAPQTADEWLEVGRSAYLESRFAEAETAFRKVVQLSPDNGAGYVELSRALLIQGGKGAEALVQAEKAVSIAPQDASAWAALSSAQLYAGKAEEALETAQKAVALGDTVHAQIALADAYRMDSRYSEALAAAARALELDPNSAEALIALATIHWERNDLWRAKAAALRAVELKPAFAPVRLTLSDIYWALGETGPATGALNLALRVAPDYIFARIAKAYQAANFMAPSEGIRLLTELRTKHPETIEVRVALADLIRQTQDASAAVPRYQEALRLNPKDVNGRLGLAQAWLDQGYCDEAAEAYDALAVEKPRLVAAWTGVSSARLCLEDVAGALEAARKAAELDPETASVQIILGNALYARGQYDEAHEAFLQALQRGPTGEEHYQFGTDFYNGGFLDQAEQEYRLAAELWPDWDAPHYALCTVYMQQNRVKEAVSACRLGYELAPSAEDMAAQYAWALLLDDQAQAALEVLTSEDVPDDALTAQLLGVTHYRMQRYEAAAEAFTQYMRLNPGPEPQFQQLVADLREGYVVLLEQAQALAQERVPAAIGRPVKIGLETRDDGPVLTVEITGQPGEKSANLTTAAGAALGAMTHVLPRVAGSKTGVEVRAFTSTGEPVVAIYADKETLQLLLLGLITGEQFLARLDFKPVAPKQGPTQWDEAAIRELGQKASEVRQLREVQPVAFRGVTGAEMGTGLDAQTEADLAAVQQDQAVLSLLGLIDPQVDLQSALEDMTEQTILGYYDPLEKTFVYRTDETPDVLQELTIVHEYVHALQDQHFTLGALPSNQVDDDRRLAYRALVEGDATLARNIYLEEQLGSDDLLTLSQEQSKLPRDLDAIPPALLSMLQFPYDAGLEFAAHLHEQGGWKALDAAFTNPPVSTEQVLHFDKYLAQEAPMTVAAPVLPQSLASAWRLVDGNVLGENGWQQVLRTRTGPMSGLAAGTGWGGDRYSLFQKGTEPAYLLAANTRWDTERDAQEFAGLFIAAMRRMLAAEETTADLLSLEPLRTWKHEGLYTAIRRAGDKVFLAIGPDEGAVTETVRAQN